MFGRKKFPPPPPTTTAINFTTSAKDVLLGLFCYRIVLLYCRLFKVQYKNNIIKEIKKMLETAK